MRKRSKHTQYFRPPIGRKRSHWGEISVSLLFFMLFACIIYFTDADPPDQLLSISGAVESRTAIYSRGKKLTGFRFCIGDPCMTFTFQQPDPRVDEAWAVVDRASRVTVLYADHADRNPSLWGLEVDGRTLATTKELRDARFGSLMTWLLGLVGSGAVAAHYIARAFRARKR
jgi:hypothetical protein